MIIERLRREIIRISAPRNVEELGTTPNGMMTGPMVLLINQYSASDGDLFPYAFKKMGFGPVIGVRSWGGVIGIRGSLPFTDGGVLAETRIRNLLIRDRRVDHRRSRGLILTS
jgi:tricorn protease